MINTHVFVTTTKMTWNTMYASYADITLPVRQYLLITLISSNSPAHFSFSIHLVLPPIIPYHGFLAVRDFQ
jgi:hypothetical protein